MLKIDIAFKKTQSCIAYAHAERGKKIENTEKHYFSPKLSA